MKNVRENSKGWLLPKIVKEALSVRNKSLLCGMMFFLGEGMLLYVYTTM